MNARVAIAWVLTALSLSCATPRARERTDTAPSGPPAPIRAFDIATIENLAQQMYAQDRIVWTATDALLAQIDEKKAAREGVRHWITGTRDGHNLVRFIRIRDGVPEAGYDVTFAGLAEPTVSAPADRTLTADEMAQYNARILALENIERPCSDRYNTIALKDPESDGWLVWALAATLDPNLVLIGGHHRFTITADGKTIRARDALSTSCLRSEKEGGETGHFMSHVVSLTPVETHAFASLSYGRTFHVGTNDGRAWRVDSGRITRVEQDSPGADGFAARALAAIDERCTMIASKTGEATQETVDGPKVIEATEHAEAFSVEAPPGTHVELIACTRKDIVPAPNDYKVAAAGYRLLIGDYGEGHPKRFLELFRVGVGFDFQIVSGPPLTDELERRVRARLESFYRAQRTTP